MPDEVLIWEVSSASCHPNVGEGWQSDSEASAPYDADKHLEQSCGYFFRFLGICGWLRGAALNFGFRQLVLRISRKPIAIPPDRVSASRWLADVCLQLYSLNLFSHEAR